MSHSYIFSTPEVRNFYLFILAQQNILRLKVAMNDSICAHNNECWNNLSQYFKNLFLGKIFIIPDKVPKVASFTVLHYNMQKLFILLKMMFIYFYEVRMIKLPHDIYFSLSFFCFKRVDFDFFVCKFLSFLV